MNVHQSEDQTRAGLLCLRRVCMDFGEARPVPLQVLENIDMQLHEGEIVGLLGRSGSAKSTLLRIACGILQPTRGTVEYHGHPLQESKSGIAMVFQTFALFPWLTVRDNVALGLEAEGVERDEIARRVAEAIDMIGLDGFQHAYPRELSGGMRQRVGFARAMVIRPEILLMDEPFSALDVLTAEILRTDFLDLWLERQIPTKAVLLVTHNIEEAVLMCDRILVLSSHPGRIATQIPVCLPRPRKRTDAAFRDVVDEIYAALTARNYPPGAQEHLPSHFLPHASVSQIIRLVQLLSESGYAGTASLAQLAHELGSGIDTLLSIADALNLLELAEFHEEKIKLTPAGKVFFQSNPDGRKRLFGEHLLEFVPLANHIRRILDERSDHRVEMKVLLDELESRLTSGEALRTLHVIAAWGRYGGLFGYDSRSRTFYRDLDLQ